jgi:general secretion pathway protein J
MTLEAQRGLTLAELLVALLVFSFVAAASVYSLRLGVEAREQLSEADARLGEFEVARMLIKEDMTQLVARAVRDEFGNALGPPFQGGTELRVRPAVPGERLLLAFVRDGWANPDGEAPRSSLQYVEYVEKEGAIIRRARPFLDDARGQPRFERVLFRGTSDVQIAFLNGEARGELQWTEGWPVGGAGGFPRAISLAFSTERFGELSQLFWIGEIAQL